MLPQTAEAIRADFLEWTGGFPPDSRRTVFVYVHYAIAIDVDEVAVTRFLLQWMATNEE